MRNLSVNTKQNAAIKQTLSIEEFVKKYICTSASEIKDWKLFSFNLKKMLRQNKK